MKNSNSGSKVFNKVYCAKCHKGANSFIVCPLCGNQGICMDHCPTCPYFAGTLEWQCLYRSKQIHSMPVATPHHTRGSQAVAQFRERMRKIDENVKENKYGKFR